MDTVSALITLYTLFVLVMFVYIIVTAERPDPKVVPAPTLVLTGPTGNIHFIAAVEGAGVRVGSGTFRIGEIWEVTYQNQTTRIHKVVGFMEQNGVCKGVMFESAGGDLELVDVYRCAPSTWKRL